MVKEKSVGAVVFRKQGKEPEFLLLHYSAGHWGFPKGRVEEGETEEQTLRREVEEETGLAQVEIIGGFKQRISYFFKRGNKTVFKEAVFCLAKAEGNVKISHEHTGFEWLSFEKALEKLTFKNTKAVLVKAKEFLGQQRQ